MHPPAPGHQAPPDAVRFATVGTGPVAHEFTALLIELGHRCEAVVSRNPARARSFAGHFGGEALTDARAIPAGVDLVLVATADAAIEETARALGGAPRGEGPRALAHFAGSFPADILRAAGDVEAISVHPLRHFEPGAPSPETFAGTRCALDGDLAQIERWERWLGALGAVTFRVRSEAKAAYHGAALFSLTFVPMLLAREAAILERCGLSPDEASGLARHLLEARLSSLPAAGRLPVLGPIPSGDAAVAGRMAQAMAAVCPEHLSLFRELAGLSADDGLASRRMSPSTHRQVLEALDPGRRG